MADQALREVMAWAAARLEEAQREEREAERNFQEMLQFAVGNGGRQGRSGSRLAHRRLERARIRRRKAETRLQRVEITQRSSLLWRIRMLFESPRKRR